MVWNRLLALGSGAGIEIRGGDLVVTLVKSRWKGVTVVGQTILPDFRRRRAAEWGEQYQAFLKNHGFGDLAATLAVPRGEVILRLLSLPAVSGAELRAAVGFQIDSLHPYGEDNVYHSFAALPRPAARPAGAAPAARSGGLSGRPPVQVAVVIAPRMVVDGYADLFAEAGVKLQGMTVAAAGYYGAVRLLGRDATGPFLLADQHDTTLELYGESETRPFFSAVFDLRSAPVEKAAAAAVAELRLADTENAAPQSPEQVLRRPLQAPPEFEMSRDATSFVAALAAACPRWGWRTNLLPPSRRSSSSRWPVAATAAAAVSVLVVGLLLALRGPIQDRRYGRELEREVKRLEGVEREVRGLEKASQKARGRRAQVEVFRRRTEADLLLLTELSRRLPNTVWINNMDVNEESVQLGGQAEAAAPLLSLIDNSGVLTGAAFASSITRVENREVFRIRARRNLALLPPAAVYPGLTGGAPVRTPGTSQETGAPHAPAHSGPVDAPAGAHGAPPGAGAPVHPGLMGHSGK